MKSATTAFLISFCIWTPLSFNSCRSSQKQHSQVIYETCSLRNGDLLFRNGCSYTSHVVTNLSNGNYSHVGIAYHDGDQWCIIHAVPNENENSSEEYLKCEPIEEFYHVDRAKHGASARVQCNDSLAHAAALHALSFVKRKITFDHDYDLYDGNRLYCTELVQLVYADLGIDLCEDRSHTFPLYVNSPVIYPEDIWKSRFLQIKTIFKTTP